MQDANNIGSTRAIPNPQDAIERQQGTYTDQAAKLSDAQKYAPLQMPAAPDPTPFTITGGTR